jgi:hypothetical protein
MFFRVELGSGSNPQGFANYIEERFICSNYSFDFAVRRRRVLRIPRRLRWAERNGPDELPGHRPGYLARDGWRVRTRNVASVNRFRT